MTLNQKPKLDAEAIEWSIKVQRSQQMQSWADKTQALLELVVVLLRALENVDAPGLYINVEEIEEAIIAAAPIKYLLKER